MTEEEVNILTDEGVRGLLREHIEIDPASFALSLKDNELPVALVSTQLKYLQKARAKLPTYYNNLCIIPPLSYEQCSSEEAASMKSYAGVSCLDLSLGLGVDTLHFSRHFDRVVAVEIQEELIRVARKNFELLGRENIELKHQPAEDFLQTYQGEPFDLIYIDPSRRDDKGKKVHLLPEGLPNVLELMPILKRKGKRVVIKASPLYDINEARKNISGLSHIRVHSINNEVKELILEVESSEISSKVPKLQVVLSRQGSADSYEFDWEKAPLPAHPSSANPRYLYEADVAFYKLRRFSTLMRDYFDSISGFFTHEMGFFLSPHWIEDFPGRIFSLEERLDYKPKALKKWLKKNSIRKAHVIARNFPFPVSQLRRQLSLEEGGEKYLIATLLEGKKVIFATERLQ